MRSWELSRISVALIVVLMVVGAPFLWAQTLGNAPQLNVAVQGQTGAQPEGAFFNFINWIGNVIAPVGAGGAVFPESSDMCQGGEQDDGCSPPQHCSLFPA